MQIALKLSPGEMLTSLYRLRWCAVVVALAIIAGAQLALNIEFAALPLIIITLLLAAWNVLVHLRLRRDWATTELEGFAHLALDTLALSALLYWGGGSTSPFVSLYLIPIAIAAAALPAVYAWGIAALSAMIYSALLLITLPAAHAGHNGFAMHVFGMWVTFIIGGLLLLVFIASMAAAVRKRDQSLAQAREQMLRNEQITAIGALAAGAAHELSTPLSTMRMLVQELRLHLPADREISEDLNTLEQQLGLCADQVDQLLGAAEQARGEPPATQLLTDWLDTVIDRWRLMRPEIRADFMYAEPFANPPVTFDPGVAQALINLLNNAADASLENGASRIRIVANCVEAMLSIGIEDYGKGLNPEQKAQAGRLRFSTKPQGRGLGLLLSHVSLERLGGEVRLNNGAFGGTCTQVELPVPA